VPAAPKPFQNSSGFCPIFAIGDYQGLKLLLGTALAFDIEQGVPGRHPWVGVAGHALGLEGIKQAGQVGDGLAAESVKAKPWIVNPEGFRHRAEEVLVDVAIVAANGAVSAYAEYKFVGLPVVGGNAFKLLGDDFGQGTGLSDRADLTQSSSPRYHRRRT